MEHLRLYEEFEEEKHENCVSLRHANESVDTQASDKLQLEIAKAIENIDDSMSYKDFAIAVAKVLKEDYGTHNFEPFVEALKAELKK